MKFAESLGGLVELEALTQSAIAKSIGVTKQAVHQFLKSDNLTEHVVRDVCRAAGYRAELVFERPNLTIYESDYQTPLFQALNGAGRATRVHRQNAGVFKSWDGKRVIHGMRKGAADLTGWVSPSGVRLEIECKRPKGKASKAQKIWLRECAAAGCLAYLCQAPAGEPVADAVARWVAEIDAIIADRGLDRG